MPFLCIDCDHNATTLLDTPMGYDPDEICFVCVGEVAEHFATLNNESVDTTLENLMDGIYIHT